jgi:hypothetical protein
MKNSNSASPMTKEEIEKWERVGNYWIHTETKERRIWHPLAEEIGHYLYNVARKLNKGKKLK